MILIRILNKIINILSSIALLYYRVLNAKYQLYYFDYNFFFQVSEIESKFDTKILIVRIYFHVTWRIVNKLKINLTCRLVKFGYSYKILKEKYVSKNLFVKNTHDK